jgi:hypothetical protein
VDSPRRAPTKIVLGGLPHRWKMGGHPQYVGEGSVWVASGRAPSDISATSARENRGVPQREVREPTENLKPVV